jgi:REP element-mobilizing transposase RayT
MPPSIGGRSDKTTTTVQPSHVVSALKVQLVLVTKDRRGVLCGQHLDALGTVSASVCADVGAELVELEG